MAALLYSEINILCVVLMLVIAVRASLLGLDKSVKFKVFITSVLLAAAANALDFLWNMGITGTWNIPPFLMCLLIFGILYPSAVRRFAGFYIPKRAPQDKVQKHKGFSVLFIPDRFACRTAYNILF